MLGRLETLRLEGELEASRAEAASLRCELDALKATVVTTPPPLAVHAASELEASRAEAASLRCELDAVKATVVTTPPPLAVHAAAELEASRAEAASLRCELDAVKASRSVRFRDEVCHRDIAVAQRVLLGLRDDILSQQENALADALALEATVAAGERRLEELTKITSVVKHDAVTLSFNVLAAEEMCGRIELVWNHIARLVAVAASYNT